MLWSMAMLALALLKFDLGDVSDLYYVVDPFRLAEDAVALVDAVWWNPLTPIAVVVLFGLERLLPAARPNSRGALLGDLSWLLLAVPTSVFFMAAAYVVLDAVAATHLAPAQRLVADNLPLWLSTVLALLLKDLAEYTYHRVAHVVRTLWVFHAVHHAQPELGPFSRDRTHPFEPVVSLLILYVPYSVFIVDEKVIATLFIIEVWFLRLQHANVRTSLGPLRHVLVSPQAHRIHHSALPEHWNKNYGVLFSFWDRMFGTAFLDHTQYPPTGLAVDRPASRRAFDSGPFWKGQLAEPVRNVARLARGERLEV